MNDQEGASRRTECLKQSDDDWEVRLPLRESEFDVNVFNLTRREQCGPGSRDMPSAMFAQHRVERLLVPAAAIVRLQAVI